MVWGIDANGVDPISHLIEHDAKIGKGLGVLQFRIFLGLLKKHGAIHVAQGHKVFALAPAVGPLRDVSGAYESNVRFAVS
jgi:hypothetical protein